jgi:tripartite-type tricarboxylate transporter receptor subunit TctC
MVATSPADGYTLFLPTVTTFSMAPQLNPKAGIDPSKELTPIARLAITNLYLTTHPSLGPKNMKEWIELMKKNPGKFSYSSSGNGSPQHIFMETLKKQLNLDIVHIPYKGSNSGMLDLLSGKVDMAFIDGTLIAPNLKTGSLVVLGSSMSKRSTLLPNVPPISDTVPGFDWSGWIGFAGPANMPQAIVEKIADFLKHYQTSAAFLQVLEKAGIEPADPIAPSEMPDFIAKENKRWAPAIKISGATVD